MNNLWIHIEPRRADVFRESHGRPLEFDGVLKAWIVLDPAIVSALLRDTSLRACPIVDSLEILNNRFAAHLTNLVAVAKRLPLGLDGADHQTVRRQLAQFIVKGQGRINDCLTVLVERHFAALASSNEVEVVAECITPFVEALFSEILGTEEKIPYRPRTIGRVFDRFTNVATLAAINAELEVLRERLVAMGVDDPDLVIAFLVLGRDSLLSTLSESIAGIVRNSAQVPLRHLVYPSVPSETGVSVTERIVGEDMSVRGVDLRKGDRLRLYFQGFPHCSGNADKLLMFGAGVHACLGRKISLDAWQALVAYLARIPRRIELVSYAVFPDPIFTMPEYVRVRLS